jgi:hypothetical protein
LSRTIAPGVQKYKNLVKNAGPNPYSLDHGSWPAAVRFWW